MHLVSASPYKSGDLFTVPVTREEDAELIWLIASILDATATDLIYLLYSDRFTEWAEYRGCMVGRICVDYCVLDKEVYREEKGTIETEGGFKMNFVISNVIAQWGNKT